MVPGEVSLTGAFIALASRYTAEGWIEFLLWETLEGKRDRPFRLLDQLTADEMEILRRMRDEAGLWVFWQDGRWCHAPIDVWRGYAEQNTADDVMRRMSGVF